MPTSVWRKLLRLPCCHCTRSYSLPARIQINSTSIRPFHYFHYDGMCLTALWPLSGIAHGVMCFTFCLSKESFCMLLCRHFQVIFSTVTVPDSPCMFMVADSFQVLYHLLRLASDKALSIMRRTEQPLCLSFILFFLLQVASGQYLLSILASLSGNHIPGHCRRLTVSCVMLSAGQLSNT